MTETKFLNGPKGKIAYRHTPGRTGKQFLWAPGFNSDMQGTKVLEVEAWARGAGHGFTAFDYGGHGASDGVFEELTVEDWHADTLAVLEDICTGPTMLLGSSMGAWMAMLAARERPERVAGMVLVAPAPDFTARLMWPSMPPEGRFAITQQGKWMQPSPYGDPVAITRALIESGARLGVMGAPFEFEGPVRILQGMRDEEVPFSHAQALVQTITSSDLTFTLVKDGDHRLSRPHDIARLLATCEEIAED
ncbi:MAG: alpha/beta hydrolase [Pseudomonadota bacterium]